LVRVAGIPGRDLLEKGRKKGQKRRMMIQVKETVEEMETNSQTQSR
jgi:hypothetical protein